MTGYKTYTGLVVLLLGFYNSFAMRNGLPAVQVDATSEAIFQAIGWIITYWGARHKQQRLNDAGLK